MSARVPGVLAVVFALAWTGVARATPDFPAVVTKTLGLPSVTVDPPQGCTLCHPTDAGGTAMRTFGSLLRQYGAQPYDEGSLEAALGQVQQTDPQLIDDIKAGRDPNDDTGAANVHTPEYGCSASRGAFTTDWSLALAYLVLLVLRRRPAPARRHARMIRASHDV